MVYVSLVGQKERFDELDLPFDFKSWVRSVLDKELLELALRLNSQKGDCSK